MSMLIRRLAKILVPLLASGFPAATCIGQELTFRMPDYAEVDPPPPRHRSEVQQLLAGARRDSPAAERPLRIVLVAGPKDHKKGEHDYPAWQQVWSRLLSQAENTVVDTAWEFPAAPQIEDADVLVFYQRGRWDTARAAAIDPFLARGGGAVYIHWAVDGRGQQLEMAQRIGLSSLGGSISYRHGNLLIDLRQAENHPITRNFDRAEFLDESYWRLSGDAARIQVLGTSLEDSAPQPQFWTLENGRGRVFVSIPGHYMWTFDDPVFRILLLRGIAWVGRKDVDRFNDLVLLDARVQ